MRRAISWVYCAPKSRIRILSPWMSGVLGWVIGIPVAETKKGNSRLPSWMASGRAVVRRFLGDLHVVHVALALAGAGHLHEGRLRAHFLDGGATDIAHRRAQATGELVDHAAERAAIRHASFDAFGNQLVGIAGILEIAILAALLHRTERAHAAIALVAAALEQLGLARAFLGAGEQAADHHAGCAGDDRLADVARVADAAVGD